MIVPKIYRPDIVHKIQGYYRENLLTSSHPIIKHILYLLQLITLILQVSAKK